MDLSFQSVSYFTVPALRSPLTPPPALNPAPPLPFDHMSTEYSLPGATQISIGASDVILSQRTPGCSLSLFALVPTARAGFVGYARKGIVFGNVVARMEAGGHGGNAVSCVMCVNLGRVARG